MIKNTNGLANELIKLKSEIVALKTAQRVPSKIKFYIYQARVQGLGGVGDFDHVCWYANVGFGDGENPILLFGDSTIMQDYTIPATTAPISRQITVFSGEGNTRKIQFQIPTSAHPYTDLTLVSTRPIASFSAYATPNRP